jgi:hypothetical protein
MICKIEYYTRRKCMLLILKAISLYIDSYKWMSIQSCLNWLVEVIPHGDRVGPLVVAGLVNDLSASANWKVPPAINYQVCFFYNLHCFSGWIYLSSSGSARCCYTKVTSSIYLFIFRYYSSSSIFMHAERR